MASKQHIVEAIFSEDAVLVEKLLKQGVDPNLIVDKPIKELSPLVEQHELAEWRL